MAPNQPEQQLLQAIRDGDAGRARSLLDSGVDPNARCGKNRDPLELAIRSGEAEIAGLLHRAGAKPGGGSASAACALTVAARAGELEVVDALAPRFSWWRVWRARRIARREAGPFCSGVPVKSVTRLLAAAAEGRLDRVERALAAGIPVDAVEPEGDGATALMLASHSLHLDVVRTLLAAGADVDHRAEGESCLFRVLRPGFEAAPGQAQLLRVLVEAGAQIEARDADGLTPLIRAVLDGPGNPVAIRTLVELGADLEAKHEAGLSALEIARQAPDKAQVVELLMELREKQGSSDGQARVASAGPSAESLRGVGQPEASELVLLVKAPIQQVSRAFEVRRCATTFQEDILDGEELAIRDEGFLIYQFRGHPWTLVQSPLIDRRALHPGDAADLSRRLEADAILYEVCDADDYFRYRLYRDGELVEDRSPSGEEIDRELAELHCYVPGLGDNYLREISRRFQPGDFERVDYVGVEERS